MARALLLNPELLICDESFSSQDILTQSQLLELLEEIQRKTQLSYLFISHDLQVVRRISQRMGVMYLGSMVEQGLTAEIYEEPWHCLLYTSSLLLQKNILIRDCSNYEGLEKGYYRIAVKQRTDNEKLLKALEYIYEGGEMCIRDRD